MTLPLKKMLKGNNKIKFMQVLDPKFYRQVSKEADRRGVNVQEVLRCLIIPDWLEYRKALKNRKRKGK